MMKTLQIQFGQYSDKGLKNINQDACALRVPEEPILSEKGIAIALADGISTSAVSQIASETAVSSFIEDYYGTPESWSVKTSGLRVLHAVNSWLASQTQKSPARFDKNKGYVCTFSAVVLKSQTAHIFHAGDTRVYHLRDDEFTQLTQDHRVVVSASENYLSRALGIHQTLDIDYQKLALKQGDYFILMSDGVYEFVTPSFIRETLSTHADNLETAADVIGAHALAKGSDDNISIQIVTVDTLADTTLTEVSQDVSTLPLPPPLHARMDFDGYTILRELHINSRSQIYLAIDKDTEQQLVIKCPSTEKRGDKDYLESLLMEEWAARRIDNPHVLQAYTRTRKRNFLYSTFEYLEGQTLEQWAKDNPEATLDKVRPIISQIAKGLQAFHRKEMLHQDLRPANILIDRHGVVKIIDFGSAYIAGIEDTKMSLSGDVVPGTMLYTAPEYFLGQAGNASSDMFSLAVISYHLLSGKFPYGTEVGKSRSRAQQLKLRYRSVLDPQLSIPDWVDETLKKALQIDPNRRYTVLSEFVHDLHHPNPKYLSLHQRPLIERNEAAFWKGVSGVLLVLLVICLAIK